MHPFLLPWVTLGSPRIIDIESPLSGSLPVPVLFTFFGRNHSPLPCYSSLAIRVDSRSLSNFLLDLRTTLSAVTHSQIVLFRNHNQQSEIFNLDATAIIFPADIHIGVLLWRFSFISFDFDFELEEAWSRPSCCSSTSCPYNKSVHLSSILSLRRFYMR